MLIRNISAIFGIGDEHPYRRGHEMSRINALEGAWLLVRDGLFAGYGQTGTEPTVEPDETIIDAAGGLVLPSFCDSHTHLVYPASRSAEFLDKINGLSYEEIAKRGGGILNSADTLASMSEDSLYRVSMERVREAMAAGTGAFEIKSGYGLTLDSELKMLRVIARIAESVSVPVRATFLGAHAVGRAYAGRTDDYVDHIIRDMLPAVASQGIASFVDVFCDTGFFSPEQTSRILEAAERYGLRPKIHGNELAVSGGVETAVSHNALSVDHLEEAGEEQLQLLGRHDTVATMLPGASFFLGMPYGKAREAISHNAILALASDFNPGSSPSGDMRFIWALGCIKMRLTPVEALNALTINGAYAMGLEDSCGTIAAGRPANFILTRPGEDAPSTRDKSDVTNLLTEIPYRYTRPWIHSVFAGGKPV